MKTKNRLCAFVLMIAVISFVVFPVVNVQAAVSSTEKKEILRFFENNCEDYMYYDTFYEKDFVFNKYVKTDMAVNQLILNRLETDDSILGIFDEGLREKYGSCYGGMIKCSKALKNKIKKQGQTMFGSSFKASFGQGKKQENCTLLYRQSYDKNYLLVDAFDYDCWTITKLKSVTKKNGIYTAKFSLTRSDYGYDPNTPIKCKAVCTMKLKKQGSSFIVKDIKQTKTMY